MAFKFVVFAALLAVANAGVVDYGYAAPSVAYAAPVAKTLVAAPAASSHASFTQHTVSHAAPVAYAAPIAKTVVSAPAYSYAQAAPAYSYAQAAPAYSYAQAAPAYSYAQAAPALQYAHAAPAIHSVQYAAAPVVHKVAAPIAYAAPIAKTVVAEPFAPAKYDFEYGVSDPHTGDVKSQKESRDGDVVHGSYSLIEADGSKRIVEYTADPHNGFNAVVHREQAAHPVAVKAVAPVVKYAAPAVQYAAAPVVTKYAAPTLSYAHAAPAISYAQAAPALTVAKYAAAPVAYAAPAHGYYH